MAMTFPIRKKPRNIFCKDCKHLKKYERLLIDLGATCTDYKCMNGNNLKITSKDNWLGSNIRTKCKRHPRRINKKNDCKWFEPKKSK